MASYDDDVVPDSEDELDCITPKEKEVSIIGAFTTPSLHAPDVSSISEFTTPNLSVLAKRNHTSADISSFTPYALHNDTPIVLQTTASARSSNIFPISFIPQQQQQQLLTPDSLAKPSTSPQSNANSSAPTRPRPKPRFAEATSLGSPSLLSTSNPLAPGSLPRAPNVQSPTRPSPLTVQIKSHPPKEPTKKVKSLPVGVIDVSSSDNEIPAPAPRPIKRKAQLIIDDEDEDEFDAPKMSPEPSRKRTSKSKPEDNAFDPSSSLIRVAESSSSKSVKPKERMKKRKSKSADVTHSDDELNLLSSNNTALSHPALPQTSSISELIRSPAPASSSTSSNRLVPVVEITSKKKRKSSSAIANEIHPDSRFEDDLSDMSRMTTTKKKRKLISQDDDSINGGTHNQDDKVDEKRPSPPKKTKAKKSTPKAKDRIIMADEINSEEDGDVAVVQPPTIAPAPAPAEHDESSPLTPTSEIPLEATIEEPTAEKLERKKKKKSKFVVEGDSPVDVVDDGSQSPAKEKKKRKSKSKSKDAEISGAHHIDAADDREKDSANRTSKSQSTPSSTSSQTQDPPSSASTPKPAPPAKPMSQPSAAVKPRPQITPLPPTVDPDKPPESLTITEVLLKANLTPTAASSALKKFKRNSIGLSRNTRIAPLHARIKTPPPAPPPIPKTKKPKKKGEEDSDDYDSEEEYALEGLTEKEKKKRREEKRNRLLYSP